MHVQGRNFSRQIEGGVDRCVGLRVKGVGGGGGGGGIYNFTTVKLIVNETLVAYIGRTNPKAVFKDWGLKEEMLVTVSSSST